MSNLVKLSICIAVTSIIWFLPVPSGLPVIAWPIFAVFIGIITSFIIRPFQMGVMVLLGLVVLIAPGIISIKEGLSGYGDSTVWLVVAAFLISGSVIRTGLGKRIALLFVRTLGKSPLGLGYSICGAELLLGPVVPSNTARGGGIIAPMVQSISTALDSHPKESPEKAGKFLTLVRSEEHTSELQSRSDLVCRLLLEKKKNK